MKITIRLVCAMVALTGSALPALAQENQTATTAAMSGAITPAQMNEMYNNYFNNYAATVSPNASLDNVQGLVNPEEEEEKKTYRYDGEEGRLYRQKLPQRSFNNIDYPY
ncbi:MAG: hypothetical protein H6867_09350 [Rhodospirillales bacterium]|nr:hypothetical protein [Rhodospirillales bacterium]MCB9995998.1 hypothetical protein [Rhodospirillales bacterium]